MTDIYEHKYKKYKQKYINVKTSSNNLSNKRGGTDDDTHNTSNNLERLIKLFGEWSNNAYSGMKNTLVKQRSSFENLISYKTKIDITQVSTLNDIKKLNLDNYEPNVHGITTFLKDFNFIESKKFSFTHPTFYRIEGSSSEHLITHNKILEDMKGKTLTDDLNKSSNSGEPQYIMEIGFNSGVSAINFLSNTKKTIVFSFDIMLHDYCWYSKMFIDNKYPGRHILISGDSAIQVKTIAPLLNFKFDLIFIDGDHNYNSAYIDIINCKEVAHKDTIVILDNVAPHAGCGIGPYLAMNQAIKENIVIFKKHYEITNYTDGFAVLGYNYDGTKSNKIDYINIERLVPVYTLTDILDKVKKLNDGDLIKLKKIIEYFKKYNLTIDDELKNKLEKYNIIN